MKILLDKMPASSKLLWVIIILTVAIGTIIRMQSLGYYTLALDEYYLIKSSENILKYWLPQFPNGGYYSRGILIQYMIAFLISLGVKAEFAGRIFSVIANLITIPALYLISKRIGNLLIATIVIVIFTFSIWEIEFARFARMYTPFQAIFIWYIYFALKDFSNKDFKNYKWLIFLSLLSVLVYEGSVFIAIFNFVPFVLNRKIKVSYLVAAIITFIGSTYFNMFDFRTILSNPILPAEFSAFINASNALPPIKIPPVLLFFAFNNILLSLLTLMLIIFNLFVSYKLITSLTSKNFWSLFSIIFLVLLALFNQFGLFLLLFILFNFWEIINVDLLNKKIVLLFSSVFFINLAYWIGFGLLNDNWYILFNDFSSYSIWGVSKRLIVGLFNFPDNYYSIYNYFETLPLMTVFSLLISVTFFYYLLKVKNYKEIKFLFGVLIFVSLFATLPTLLYQETRYTFFEVPLLLMTLVTAISFLTIKLFKGNQNLSHLFLIIISLGIFIVSKDFNLYHLANIDKAEVNYRMNYSNNNYRKHLYRRWDTKTPTDFVKKNMSSDDLIMINENSQEYYLPKVDYFSFDYRHSAFSTLSVENGKKERWSNANLIYTNNDLLQFIENRTKTIWFIVYPESYLHDFNFYERYKNNLVCKGIDGMIKVYNFPVNNFIK